VRRRRRQQNLLITVGMADGSNEELLRLAGAPYPRSGRVAPSNSRSVNCRPDSRSVALSPTMAMTVDQRRSCRYATTTCQGIWWVLTASSNNNICGLSLRRIRLGAWDLGAIGTIHAQVARRRHRRNRQKDDDSCLVLGCPLVKKMVGSHLHGGVTIGSTTAT
jgi:hypothetical protein